MKKIKELETNSGDVEFYEEDVFIIIEKVNEIIKAINLLIKE